MLRRLSIRDFVIVDHLELEFAEGFGALTGETGAGKSILLDALGLALGDRADGGVVRVGRERADISAEFDIPPGEAVTAWLAAQELSAEDGVLLLRRVVDAGGRSRAWINATPATLGQLRELAEWLADIHGQHAHHALLRGDNQRNLLDAHGGLGAEAAQVATLYRAWQTALEARRAAEAGAAASARERELLEWQVQELQGIALSAADWEELNAEHGRLGHAAGLIEGAEELVNELADGEIAVQSRLEDLACRLGELAAYDAGLQAFQELLDGAAIQVSEAVHGLRRYREKLELDPQRLQELDERIGSVTDAARKYRVSPEELPELLEGCRRRLAALEESSDPAALAAREAEAEARYRAAAQALSARRAPVAEALSQAVSAIMHELAMEGGRFQVALQPTPQGTAAGLEQVEFQVAANAGQTLRPMARVASGGEISRIGLAIQVITSRNGIAPTLIFDEVDVGIGGRVAEIVGKLLRQLGAERQVLCVTHLPQVAAQANWQWSIAKARRGEETLSAVTVLDRPGRVEEIARMLGGVDITDTTRRHAREMLAVD